MIRAGDCSATFVAGSWHIQPKGHDSYNPNESLKVVSRTRGQTVCVQSEKTTMSWAALYIRGELSNLQIIPN